MRFSVIALITVHVHKGVKWLTILKRLSHLSISIQCTKLPYMHWVENNLVLGRYLFNKIFQSGLSVFIGDKNWEVLIIVLLLLLIPITSILPSYMGLNTTKLIYSKIFPPQSVYSYWGFLSLYLKKLNSRKQLIIFKW